MRGKPVSTQAMFEFQRMTRTISDRLTLVRTGKFWELWYVGDDFNKSEAEIAALQESYFSYDTSHKYGDIRIAPEGVIRSLDFGADYKGLPVLAQLNQFLDRHATTDSYITNCYLDLRPNGNMIDVDVKAVEDDCGYNADNVYVEGTYTRTIATFTYDPAENLLLHRAVR